MPSWLRLWEQLPQPSRALDQADGGAEGPLLGLPNTSEKTDEVTSSVQQAHLFPQNSQRPWPILTQPRRHEGHFFHRIHASPSSSRPFLPSPALNTHTRHDPTCSVRRGATDPHPSPQEAARSRGDIAAPRCVLKHVSSLRHRAPPSWAGLSPCCKHSDLCNSTGRP